MLGVQVWSDHVDVMAVYVHAVDVLGATLGALRVRSGHVQAETWSGSALHRLAILLSLEEELYRLILKRGYHFQTSTSTIILQGMTRF